MNFKVEEVNTIVCYSNGVPVLGCFTLGWQIVLIFGLICFDEKLAYITSFASWIKNNNSQYQYL